MEIKNLLDVCDINDKTVDDFQGMKNYVATGDVDYDKIISFDEVSYDDKPSRANREVEVGDILVAKMKETVKVVKITEENYFKYIFSTGFSTLKAKEDKLNNDYLYCILISDNFQNQKDKYSKGATQKAINNTGLKKIKIPVPPINIQKQIVEILDKAQALIDNRKEQIKLLDDLIESVFYDMFGDPVRNDKGWNIYSWEEIFNTTTGKLNANAMVEDGKYPFFTCAKEIFNIDSYSYDCEALLLAGNNASADYDIKYYKGKFDAYQRTYILTLKNNYNYFYFKIVLEKQLLKMKSISKGTNTKYLTLKLLKGFNLAVPPIPLQNQFGEKVDQIESQRQLLEDSLELLKDNYNNLMQKAFKGQLF